MPEMPSSVRIQPCLLDRLMDEAPAERLESRLQRVMTSTAFRECVRRDIGDLLNTHSRLCREEAAAFPRAAQSVLNYGMQDLSGAGLTALECSELERHLASVLRTFEPRLISQTVQVRAVGAETGAGSPTRISFEIRANLWSRPAPEAWFLKTEIDLESGAAAVSH